MVGFEVEIGPVLLNPRGGIVHGVELPGGGGAQRIRGGVFVQREEHVPPFVEDEFFETLQNVTPRIAETKWMRHQSRQSIWVIA